MKSTMDQGRSSWLARALLAGLLLLSAVAVPLVRSSSSASAATVYCGTELEWGIHGGITWNHYIDVYSDPSCFATSRYIAYDFYATTHVVVDDIYIDFFRFWLCGSGPYGAGDTPNPYVSEVNMWSGWWGIYNCGEQADSQVHFYKAGAINKWNYIEIG